MFKPQWVFHLFSRGTVCVPSIKENKGPVNSVRSETVQFASADSLDEHVRVQFPVVFPLELCVATVAGLCAIAPRKPANGGCSATVHSGCIKATGERVLVQTPSEILRLFPKCEGA